MKLLRPCDRKRKLAMYLALNWYLSDLEDQARALAWEAESDFEPRVTYTSHEVKEHLAMRYTGRFKTKRLRKKHSETITILKQRAGRLRTKTNAT